MGVQDPPDYKKLYEEYKALYEREKAKRKKDADEHTAFMRKTNRRLKVALHKITMRNACPLCYSTEHQLADCPERK